MAYESISNIGESPFFNTLYSEGKFTANEFAFSLGTSGSQLYLGGINSAKYTGSITYTPVTSQGVSDRRCPARSVLKSL